MNYVKLGRTGLDCSRIGFGTWQIGGGRWKATNEYDAVAVLQSAEEHGINLYDAAIVYGQYRGELNERRSFSLELLGKAFDSTARRRVFVCPLCSYIFYTGQGYTGRNYLNLRNCDIGLFVGGEAGTLEEFCGWGLRRFSARRAD